MYLSQFSGHQGWKGSRSQSGLQRGSVVSNLVQSGGQFLLKGFSEQGQRGSWPAKTEQLAGHLGWKGVLLQSGGQRGSLSPKFAQSGVQLGWIGLALQGQRSSFPLNMLQSGGHLGFIGSWLQSTEHLESLPVYFRQSSGHFGLKGSRSQSGRQRVSSVNLRQSGGHLSLKGSFSQSNSSSRLFGCRHLGSIRAVSGSSQDIGPPKSSTPSLKGAVVVVVDVVGIGLDGKIRLFWG